MYVHDILNSYPFLSVNKQPSPRRLLTVLHTVRRRRRSYLFSR